MNPDTLNSDKLLALNTVKLMALNAVHCKEQPVFEHLGYTYGDFPESEKASREVLSLPMHPFLSEVEQKIITGKLIQYLQMMS